MTEWREGFLKHNRRGERKGQGHGYVLIHRAAADDGKANNNPGEYGGSVVKA